MLIKLQNHLTIIQVIKHFCSKKKKKIKIFQNKFSVGSKIFILLKTEFDQ